MINSSYDGLPASANFGVHHGDMIEGKLIDDPHFTITGSEPGGIIPQMFKAVEKLTPVKDKLITVLQGNHERKLQARWGDITAWVCHMLGVTYGTMAAKISYFSELPSTMSWDTPKKMLLFKQYAIHGRRQVKSAADDVVRQNSNMQLALKRHLKNEAGDVILMTKGHTHHLFTLPPQTQLYLVDDGRRIQQEYTSADPTGSQYIHPDLRWYINVGAFFRKYGDDLVNFDVTKPLEGARSSYVEENEYPPIELGFAVVLVRGGKIVDVNLEVVD
jgi:hypothetical protein